MQMISSDIQAHISRNYRLDLIQKVLLWNFDFRTREYGWKKSSVTQIGILIFRRS